MILSRITRLYFDAQDDATAKHLITATLEAAARDLVEHAVSQRSSVERSQRDLLMEVAKELQRVATVGAGHFSVQAREEP